MKRIFTLAVMALMLGSMSASAQSLRKTWDFRDGFSTQTINALKGDQEEFGPDKYWRNYEGDATKADEQHFWNASKEAKNADGFACTHNGGQEKVIPELEGLVLGMSNAKKFVVTYNGAQKPNEFESEGGPAIGEMIPHGNSYVWLNGKNETISFQAEVNQKIRIAVESHAVNATKLGEARGISLTAEGGTLTPDFEGNPVPVYYTEYEWELSGDAGSVATITLKSTNGCHIYYIIVGEGDDPNANKIPIAYLTSGNGLNEDAYKELTANKDLAVTVIDATEKVSWNAETLQSYQAVVISKELNEYSDLLKEVLPFIPVLNLNANLYKVWGYGVPATASMPLAIIPSLKSPLFTGFEQDADYIDVDGVLAMELGADGYTGVKLGEYFAGDDILAHDAEDEQLAAVHVHNIYHNGYVYLPAEAVTVAPKLLANAISTLAASKTEVTQAPAPKIILDYKDQNTNITLAMASTSLPKPRIFYTLDGTDPTEASTLYTEPLNVTKETVVKAVALAEGYLLSPVAEMTVGIFSQPATPAIIAEYNEGETIVTLTCDTEGADIWYNYNKEQNDTTKSMKYNAPISFRLPSDLTVFAVAGGMVFSEAADQRIVVKNPTVRQDQLGLFDANAADWQKGGSGGTIYYFSWGKNAANVYDETQDPIGTTVDENGDEVPVYPERDFEYYIPESETNYWEVKSKGQVLIWQQITVGSDPGNGGGYNPETTGDIISYAPATSHDIQFAGKVSGNPYTGSIQSLKKFQAPFDLVTIVGTAAGGDNVGRMVVEVSTDSTEWTTVGEEMATSTVKRLWKSYVRSYDGTDEVYVRVRQAGGGSSVQIYNIYVLCEGEQSLALKEQYNKEFEEAMTGIADVRRTSTAAAGIYTLDGVRHHDLQHGLNIVVSSDGQVRKVLVK